MSATGTASELSALAAEAWRLLVADPNPVPALAVDWLRERACCEDVADVKRALYEAAADELAGYRVSLLGYQHPEDADDGFSWQVVSSVRARDFQKADEAVAWWRRDDAGEHYAQFRDLTQRALTLCRLIEAA